MLADFCKIVVQIQFTYHFKGQTFMFQLGLKTSQNISHRKRKITPNFEFRRFRHNNKNIKVFLMKFSIFAAEKIICILHKRVFIIPVVPRKVVPGHVFEFYSPILPSSISVFSPSFVGCL